MSASSSSSSSSSPHAPLPKRAHDDNTHVCNIAPFISKRVRRMEATINLVNYRDAAAHSSHLSSQLSQSISVVVVRDAPCIESIMQFLSVPQIMALAQTSRSMLLIARNPNAWKYVGAQPVRLGDVESARVYGLYHPLLLRMFDVTLDPSIDRFADDNAFTTDIEMLQSMRVTTITVTPAAHRYLQTGFRAPNVLALLWCLTTLVIEECMGADTTGLVYDIINYSPRLLHVIFEHTDHPVPLPLVVALKNKVGLRTLKMDTSRCIYADAAYPRSIISSPHLQRSLTHLMIGAQWESDDSMRFVDRLHRLTSLTTLHLDRICTFAWPTGRYDYGRALSVALPPSVTLLVCNIYCCMCSEAGPRCINKRNVNTAASNIVYVAQQGAGIKCLRVIVGGCAYTVDHPASHLYIEDAVRDLLHKRKVGIRVEFVVQIMQHERDDNMSDA